MNLNVQLGAVGGSKKNQNGKENSNMNLNEIFKIQFKKIR